MESGDLLYGCLGCCRCPATFPVLDGVAIVYPEPSFIVRQQRSVISKHVDPSLLDSEEKGWLMPPPKFMGSPGGPVEEAIDYAQAAAFLTADGEKWWGNSDPVAKSIDKYWDDNPVTRIGKFLEGQSFQGASILDLGCGVGGTLRRLGKYFEVSLGIDRAFSAVWTARAVMNGRMRALSTAGDLLQGPASKTTDLGPVPEWAPRCDFVLGDVLHPPVESGGWSVVTALGVIDVVAEPLKFVELHASLAAPGGRVIQGSPYHWRPAEAARIIEVVPEATTSPEAVEWLYSQRGLEILDKQDNVPWMIFRYSRQVVLYAYHFFIAEKPGAPL